MGRRAKNKQGDPEPIEGANGAGARPSAKKLGKRKAEVEGDATSKRPAKKLKEEVRPKKGADKKSVATKEQVKKTKGPLLPKKAPLKKRKDESEESEEDDEDAEGASSAGWEDVEDDVKAEAKYVL